MKKLLILLFAVTLTGCFEDKNSQPMMKGMVGGYGGRAISADLAVMSAPPMAQAKGMRSSEMTLDRSQFEGRHIAESHQLQVETPREDLQTRYQRDLKQCVKLGCQIIGSQIQSDGYGYLNARISPENLGKYLDFITQGPGEVKSHQVGADDMTSQYVDTEARLKNQTALRDRLLKLLEAAAAKKVEDILNIERELARVQGEIDSLKGQREALTQQTARAMVSVNYSVPPRAVEIEYHDIANSLRYAWNGFLQSVSEAIAFVLRAIPWIPTWFVGGWLLVKVIRFALRKTGANLTALAFWKKKI